MVATSNVEFPIRLEGIAIIHVTFTRYKPKLFPGLIYGMLDPKIVLLIFVSGKVFLTGGKSRDDLQKAVSKIYPVL